MSENVPAAVPVARSPIEPAPPEVVVAGWAVSGRRSDAPLTITDCTPLAKVTLRAPPDGALAGDLGVPFGRARRSTPVADLDVLLVGRGPGEWLALGPPDAAASLVDWLQHAVSRRPHEFGTVVDVTHSRALLRLTGERAADLLARECSVDLSDRACPDGTALRSDVSGVAADVVRDDRGAAPSYLIHCEWSVGRYLFESLLDGGAELGVDVDGFGDQDGFGNQDGLGNRPVTA